MKKKQECLGIYHYRWQKIGKMMKLCIILVCLFSFSLSATTLAQRERVNLKLQEVPLRQVLEQIREQTHLQFMMSKEQGERVGRVSVDAWNETVAEVLDKIFASTGLTWVVKEDIIVVKERPQQQPAPIRVKGVVKDEKGHPLPGVTVLVKGTALGVVTDVNGNYNIELPGLKEVSLLFSFIGMETQEIAYTGQKEINVTMNEEATRMDEVVVTGIFQKAKESYTGAATTIRKDKLRMYRGQNMLQTLRNIDASLNISMNNTLGSDPNALPQINIRGTSSLPVSIAELNENTKQSVNMPLIIMDGFEITLTKLMDYNDEDIESITILKDASATAIYGSQGANGVIVVTSKQPEEGKLRVTAQIGLAAEIPDLTSYDMLDAGEKLELENSIGLYVREGHPSSTAKYQKIYNKRLKDVLSGVNTDWLSQPLRNGVGGRYSLRLEGGREEFRWSTSISYKNTAGAMKGSARRVFTGDITLMYVYKTLTFRNNTSVTNSLSRNSPYGSFSDYVSQQPYNRIYDNEGNLIRYFDNFYANAKVQNPLYDATLHTIDKSKDLSLINNFAIDWKVLPELTIRGQFGITSNHTDSDLFYPAEHSKFSDKTFYPVGSTNKGSYDFSTGETFSCDGRLTLSYSKVFNDVHQLYAGVDYTVSGSNSKNYKFKAEGFSNQDLSSIGNALQYPDDATPLAAKSASRRLGITGNINYTYDNRYYADASFRVDGSSQFGANKRYAPFWSVGIGWNIHREKFLAETEWINSLRLKASIGETGAMDFSKSDVLTMYTYPAGSRYGLWNAAQLQGLGNENLTWQKTNSVNVGLEFDFFNRRIFAAIDYYIKKTDGLVSAMNLPLTMGFASYSENVGKVENTGYELSIGGYPLRTGDFSWMINGQLVYNRNRITKLSDAIKAQNETYITGKNLSDSNPANLLYEGRTQYGIYAVRSLGIDPATGEEMFLDKDGHVTNTWDTKDRVYCGQDATYASPYRGNLSTIFRWRNLSFNMSFAFQWGGKMYNSTLRDRVEVSRQMIMSSNVDRRVYDKRWQQPGNKVFFKKIGDYNTDSYRTPATSRFVMKDHWFEIQTAGLEYRWSTAGLRKATGLQSILFSANMNNLWHFSSVRYERGTYYPFARNLQAAISLLF